MKALFLHDTPIKLYNGHFYDTILTADIWRTRYLSVFDSLLISCRQINITNSEIIKRYSLSEYENVEFQNILSYQGPIDYFIHKKSVLNEISRVVDQVDCAIIRLPSFLGIIAIQVCEMQNKPYLIEMVACPWDGYWNHGKLGKILAPYAALKTRKMIQKSPYVIYVTSRFLQKRYPNKNINTSCSDVALNDFDDLILEKRLKKINDMGKQVILGTTADVGLQYKGQQYVLKALFKLKKKGIVNIKYQMAGYGDQTRLLALANKLGITDQIEFLGALTHDEVFSWLDTIDLYIQPSRQEGLPRALIEAMSRGLPCCGANTGGIPELIESKFIFSNNNNEINEICDILTSFDSKIMRDQAIRNYGESKKFVSEYIEMYRNTFISEFTKSVKNIK